MATIVTRSGKGSPLTNTEVDANFTNLNSDKIETNAEVRAAVEAASDSNVFTDADHTKLDGIAASANNYSHPTGNGNNHIPSNGSSGQILGYASAGTAQWQAASSSDLVDDTSPQLGGNLDVNGQEIVTISNGDLNIAPNGHGVVQIKGNSTGGSGKLSLTAGSSQQHSIKIQAPATPSSGYVLTLPDTNGSSNQVLKTDGSGNLDWTTIGGADLYSANNSAGGTDPSATGSNSVAIGEEAVSTGSEAVALGKGRAAGSRSFSVLIGDNTSSYGASGDSSASIGRLSKATAAYSFSVGYYAASSGYGSISMGSYSIAMNESAIALGTSRASGVKSFAVGIDNNSASYGATGPNSVAIGYLNKATGSKAFCFSNTSTASGSNSGVFGGNSGTASGGGAVVIGGSSNTASGGKSTARGYYGNTNGITLKHATGGGPNKQGAYYVLSYSTTDATPIALNTDSWTPNATNQIILPNNSAYSFSGTIIAREQASAGSDYASWEIKGALLRDANAASTVLGNGIQNKMYATSGASAWAIALTADTTNGGLKIEVTGAASTNIRWVATVNTSEVTY